MVTSLHQQCIACCRIEINDITDWRGRCSPGRATEREREREAHSLRRPPRPHALSASAAASAAAATVACVRWRAEKVLKRFACARDRYTYLKEQKEADPLVVFVLPDQRLGRWIRPCVLRVVDAWVRHLHANFLQHNMTQGHYFSLRCHPEKQHWNIIVCETDKHL